MFPLTPMRLAPNQRTTGSVVHLPPRLTQRKQQPPDTTRRKKKEGKNKKKQKETPSPRPRPPKRPDALESWQGPLQGLQPVQSVNSQLQPCSYVGYVGPARLGSWLGAQRFQGQPWEGEEPGGKTRALLKRERQHTHTHILRGVNNLEKHPCRFPVHQPAWHKRGLHARALCSQPTWGWPLQDKCTVCPSAVYKTGRLASNGWFASPFGLRVAFWFRSRNDIGPVEGSTQVESPVLIPLCKKEGI